MRTVTQSVGDLLPHAPPMVLLDNVLGWDQGKVAATVIIHANSPFFVENRGVPSYVGLEYMAQTCGVYAGLEANAHGKPVRLGFLLGTRNYHASKDWFSVGDRLVIEAVEMFRQEGMGVFDCRITCGDDEVAAAQLSLYQPEDNQAEEQKNG